MRNKINSKQVSYIFLLVYILGWIFDLLRERYDIRINTVDVDVITFLIVVIIAQIGVHFMPSLIYTLFKKEDLKEVYRFNRINYKQLLLSIALYLLGSVTTLFIRNLMDFIAVLVGKEYVMSTYPIAADLKSLLILFLCFSIIAPFCEDLLFRGFMLTGCEKNGRFFAIVYTSLAFALFHDNPYRLLEIFYYAIIAGLIVYYTNSIWTGIIIHFITNTCYVVSSYLIGGDMTMNSGIDAAISTINKEIIIRLIGLGGIAVISIILSMFVVKKLKSIWIDNGGLERESKVTINKFPLYKIFNLPMITVIVLFIIKNL